jgi:hypothetical protein
MPALINAGYWAVFCATPPKLRTRDVEVALRSGAIQERKVKQHCAKESWAWSCCFGELQP